MSQVILNVLCEGQTEDGFAQEVLKPYLKEFGIAVKTQLLLTNKKKNIRGGMISYQRAKMDLDTWMRQCGRRPAYEIHYFTTMFDLYALPDDFPAYADASKLSDCYMRVEKLETAFAADINVPHFIPYIQLHEFEALVFCGLAYLLVDYPDMREEVERLKQIVTAYNDNPETINNSVETAPSKRIIKEFVSKHNYDKPKSGKFVTGKVGIPALKAKCPHFKTWIEQLEQLADND